MIDSPHEIRLFDDLPEISIYAAELFMEEARKAAAERGRFCVCLSGGSTPRDLYSNLAIDPVRSEIPWKRVHAFWGDERCVPTDHPENLYAMVRELLLSEVPIPNENVHRMRGEAKNPWEAAAEYEEMLRDFFSLRINDHPRFDLILLGMGSDGHIASLFPGTAGLAETRRLAIANYVPSLNANRLTLTLPVFNNAALVMFLVAGESKAGALRSLFSNIDEEQRLPAGLIRPQSGRVLWLIDQAAGVLLEQSGEQRFSKLITD